MTEAEFKVGDWVQMRSGAGGAWQVTKAERCGGGWWVYSGWDGGDVNETQVTPATAPTLGVVLDELAQSWVIDEAEAALYAAERERQSRRLNLAKLDGVITDEDIERIVWDRLDVHDGKRVMSVAAVRRFLAASVRADGPRFCWLAGDLGLGKTVAACLAIAMERGRYVTADQLWLAYSAKTQEAADLRHYMTHCRLLVVDDIGTERDAAGKHAIHQLVNARQGKSRLTIFTGNGTRAEVRASLDPRTVARIEHQGGIVECKGENLRRRPRDA